MCRRMSAAYQNVFRTSELDDITLARARAGEQDALHALVKMYESRVYALLGRMLGGDVRDLDRPRLEMI